MNAYAGRFIVISVALHAGLLVYWPVAAPPPPAAARPLLLSLNSGEETVDQGDIKPHSEQAPPRNNETAHTATVHHHPRPSPQNPPASLSGTQVKPQAPAGTFNAAASAASAVRHQDSTQQGNPVVAPMADAEQAVQPAELAIQTAVPDPASVQRYLYMRLRAAVARYFSYPLLAQRRGWEGNVTLGLRVQHDGRLSDIHIISSSGHGIIDRDALRVLRQITRIDDLGGWLEEGHFDMVLPIEYYLTDG